MHLFLFSTSLTAVFLSHASYEKILCNFTYGFVGKNNNFTIIKHSGMKNKILLIAILPILASSCATSYRSGQTPDDVYYSPSKHIDDLGNDKKKSEDVAKNSEDREIRMKSHDPRWRELDDQYDCNCNYHPYKYGYTCGYYYNPYYYPYPVHLTQYIYTPVRTTNLSSYNTTPVSIKDPKTGATRQVSTSVYYNTSNNSPGRQVYYPSNDNNTNTRTYTPAATQSGSSGSPAVSRPVRH